MSQADETRSRSEEPLVAGLRRLACSSPQAAPPELGDALVRAFHRHHRRRRVMRGVAVAAVILLTCSAPFWRRPVPDNRQPANQIAVESHQAGPQPVPVESASGEMFMALPSFAFATRGEDLRVIRVEMPVASLRLLGVRVNDELITHRVVADLLIGADGTPYAFRLVS